MPSRTGKAADACTATVCVHFPVSDGGGEHELVVTEQDTIGSIREKAWQVLWDRSSEGAITKSVLMSKFEDWGLVRRAVAPLPDEESVLEWCASSCSCRPKELRQDPKQHKKKKMITTQDTFRMHFDFVRLASLNPRAKPAGPAMTINMPPPLPRPASTPSRNKQLHDNKPSRSPSVGQHIGTPGGYRTPSSSSHMSRAKSANSTSVACPDTPESPYVDSFSPSQLAVNRRIHQRAPSALSMSSVSHSHANASEESRISLHHRDEVMTYNHVGPIRVTPTRVDTRPSQLVHLPKDKLERHQQCVLSRLQHIEVERSSIGPPPDVLEGSSESRDRVLKAALEKYDKERAALRGEEYKKERERILFYFLNVPHAKKKHAQLVKERWELQHQAYMQEAEKRIKAARKAHEDGKELSEPLTPIKTGTPSRSMRSLSGRTPTKGLRSLGDAKVDDKPLDCLVLTSRRLVQFKDGEVQNRVYLDSPFSCMNTTEMFVGLKQQESEEKAKNPNEDVVSSFPFWVEQKAGDRAARERHEKQRTLSDATTLVPFTCYSADVGHFLQQTAEYYREKSFLENTVKSMAALTDSYQVNDASDGRLRHWSTLMQSVLCTVIFHKDKLPGYRHLLIKLLASVQEKGVEGVSKLSIRLAKFVMPTEADEIPRLSMLERRETGKHVEYLFDFDMNMRSIQGVVQIKGKKLRMGFSIEVGIKGVQVKGVLRLRCPPHDQHQMRVSFVQVPELLYNLDSKVKVGSVRVPFQRKIEGLISEKLIQAIRTQLKTQMVNNWQYINNAKLPNTVKLLSSLKRWDAIAKYNFKMDGTDAREMVQLGLHVSEQTEKALADTTTDVLEQRDALERAMRLAVIQSKQKGRRSSGVSVSNSRTNTATAHDRTTSMVDFDMAQFDSPLSSSKPASNKKPNVPSHRKLKSLGGSGWAKRAKGFRDATSSFKSSLRNAFKTGGGSASSGGPGHSRSRSRVGGPVTSENMSEEVVAEEGSFRSPSRRDSRSSSRGSFSLSRGTD